MEQSSVCLQCLSQEAENICVIQGLDKCNTVEHPVGDHPICQALVVAYGRRSLARAWTILVKILRH